jgi:hypothetical protein
MATLLAYGAIKFLMFGLVVASGLILMAGHSADDQITQWKCWVVALIIWAAIIALAGVE